MAKYCVQFCDGVFMMQLCDGGMQQRLHMHKYRQHRMEVQIYRCDEISTCDHLMNCPRLNYWATQKADKQLNRERTNMNLSHVRRVPSSTTNVYVDICLYCTRQKQTAFGFGAAGTIRVQFLCQCLAPTALHGCAMPQSPSRMKR